MARRRQHGGGLPFILAVIALALASAGALALSSSSTEQHRHRASDRALAQAREALLAYAADRPIDARVGPGYLPCPDLDDDGWAEATCGSLSGHIGQEQRLGRLPWKTLGLPDLRDGYGERLWYAVSTRYKGLLNCAASAACVMRNDRRRSRIRDPITERRAVAESECMLRCNVNLSQTCKSIQAHIYRNMLFRQRAVASLTSASDSCAQKAARQPIAADAIPERESILGGEARQRAATESSPLRGSPVRERGPPTPARGSGPSASNPVQVCAHRALLQVGGCHAAGWNCAAACSDHPASTNKRACALQRTRSRSGRAK